MTVNKYITLANNAAPTPLEVNYRAVAMQPVIHNMDNVENAADGSPDVANGSRFRSWSYVLRVPIDDPADQNEGCYADLESLFLQNNPGAIPNNIIVFTDHFGTDHNVIFIGDMQLEPLTTMLTGSSGYYMIPIRLREI